MSAVAERVDPAPSTAVATALRVALVASPLALGACAGTGTPHTDDAPSVPVPVAGVPIEDSREDAHETDGREPPLPPARDADRDGVADAADDCPDSAPDEIVDELGCPLFTRVLDGVVFAQGDHRLGAESRLALDALVSDLQTHPEVVIRLEGHTDNRGTAGANLELSKLRVMSVARFLVAAGIAPERMRPYGFGESRPRAGNATEAGRERNRRIEIRLESAAKAPVDTLAEPVTGRQNGGMPENNP